MSDSHCAVISMSLVRSSMFILAILGGCLAFALAEEDPQQAAKDALIVETVQRLESFDLNSSEKAKGAVLRHMRRQPGTPQFFELIKKFKIVDLNEDLLKLVVATPTETAGVESAELLLAGSGSELLTKTLQGENAEEAGKVAQALGLVGNKAAQEMLALIVVERKHPPATRIAAVTALGKSPGGQKALLAIVQAEKLLPDLKFAAANALLTSAEPEIRAAAGKHLQLPATAGNKPLPPISELLKMPGDVGRGKIVFETVGTCNKCHTVAGQGKEIGPNLTEIGSKLSREALIISILDPSAAISHNFESFEATTEDGLIVIGLLVSKTEKEVTLKTAEGIVRPLPAADLELRKLHTSLMPQDLQKLLSPEQLVDVVEYLASLKKP